MLSFNNIREELRSLGLILRFNTDHYLLKFANDRTPEYGYVAEDLGEAVFVGRALIEWRNKVPGKVPQLYYMDMQRVNRDEPLDPGKLANGTPNIVKLHHPFFRRQDMYEERNNVVRFANAAQPDHVSVE